VPEPVQPGARPERTADERAADHAAIDRLSAELLPALIAKLGATGLGELEVRESGWRVRLRRPGDGHGGGQGSGASAGSRERRPGERERVARSGAGPGGAHLPSGLTAVGPGREVRDGPADSHGHTHSGNGHDGGQREGRTVATSPAVGVFQPRAESRAGTKVRAGDRLGSVDMLGIPQEVVSPADGVVGASLVEPGDAVEYGQELILIEFASNAPSEA
jgi:biotin carboxyl carrier protein